MTLTIYGDFTDPLSWLASLRADALCALGIGLEWRAVAELHSIWVTPRSVDADRQRRFTALEDWHRRAALPGDPAAPPSAPATTPWPDPAVAGYAEAVGAGVGDYVRCLLFAGYWQEGRDIGNLEILRQMLTVPILHGNSTSEVLSVSGNAIAINGGPSTSVAFHLIETWRRDWEALGRPPLPTVLDGTTTTVGLEALDHLNTLVTNRNATMSAVNPFRLPPMPLPARRVSYERVGIDRCWWDP